MLGCQSLGKTPFQKLHISLQINTVYISNIPCCEKIGSVLNSFEFPKTKTNLSIFFETYKTTK